MSRGIARIVTNTLIRLVGLALFGIGLDGHIFHKTVAEDTLSGWAITLYMVLGFAMLVDPVDFANTFKKLWKKLVIGLINKFTGSSKSSEIPNNSNEA